MVRRTAAEGVRVEIPGDDHRTARHSIQQKFHLNAATACRPKNLEVDISDGDGASRAAIKSGDQRMAVAFTLLHAFHVIEAGGQQQVFRIQDRKPGEDRIALNGCRVFTG